MSSVIRYVYREDARESFEQFYSKELESENCVFLGFPGVGKSTSALAIAAIRILEKKPAIYLKIERGESVWKYDYQIMKIKDKEVAVPIIHVPTLSLDPETILQHLINAISLLQKASENISHLMKKVKESQEDLNVIDLIHKSLNEIIPEIPKNLETISSLANIVLESSPYVGSALKIFSKVNTLHKKHKIKKLEMEKLLIIVDDLEDLQPNWIVLQTLLSYNFNYLFVIRVEEAKEYLNLLNDKTYVSKYLEHIGIPVVIKKNIILPLPSYQIFKLIMSVNVVDDDKIETLWELSGGIPVIALMLWINSKQISFEQLELKVKNNIKETNSSISWKISEPDVRLAFTLYAVKTIFKELKTKNFGFVALITQKNGLSIEELALFCGLTFGEISTDNKSKLKNIIDFLDFENLDAEIKVYDKPSVGMPCQLHYEDNFVLSKKERTLGSEIIGEKININNVDFYSFNSLFDHIPLLIRQLEKIDPSIHEELNKTRKILLRCIYLNMKQTGQYSTRQLFASYDHIEHLDDFNETGPEVVMILSTILLNSPLLVFQFTDFKKLLNDVIKQSQKHTRELAKLLTTLCYLLRYERGELRNWLPKIIIQIIEQIKSSEDRITLLYLSQAISTVEELDISYKQILDTVHLDSKSLVSKICKNEDSLCFYAKSLVYTESAGSLFSKKQYSEAEKLFAECHAALSKLKKIDLTKKEQSWFRELSVKPENEIYARSASLNAVRGTLKFYQDDLDNAIKRYQIATSEYKKLKSPEGFFQTISGELICEFLKKNTTNIQKNLESIAKMDHLVTNKETKNDILSFVRLPKLAQFHIQSIVSRAILDHLYHKNTKLDLDNTLIWNPADTLTLNCGLIILEKFFADKFDITPVINEAVQHFADENDDSQISATTLSLWIMYEKKLDVLDLGNQKFSKEVIIQSLSDFLKEKNTPIFFEKFCNVYRNKVENGLIIDALLTMSLEHNRTTAIIFQLTIFLVHEDFDLAKVFLFDLLERNQDSSYLLKRLSNQLRKSIKEYQKRKNPIDLQKMILDFFRLWYYYY